MKTRQLSHIPFIMISFFQIGRSFRVRCILERIMQSSVPTRLLCAMASWRFVVLSVNQWSLQCLRFYIPWLNSARLITYPLLTWTFSCKKWHDNEQDCRRMGKDEPSHVNDNPPFSLWCPNGHLELTCLWWCLGRYIILNGSVPLYTSSMCTVLWMTFPACANGAQWLKHIHQPSGFTGVRKSHFTSVFYITLVHQHRYEDSPIVSHSCNHDRCLSYKLSNQ